jgi:uncharacterized cupredoxin-like copper-binding protein
VRGASSDCNRRLIVLLALTPAAPSAGAVKTVTLTASEFRFAPASVTLKVGQRVALQVTNRGGMDHEFLSSLLKAARDVEIKVEGGKAEVKEVEEVEVEPRHTVTVEFTPTRPGTYAFWCAETFQGKLHRDLGMRGTITVTR